MWADCLAEATVDANDWQYNFADPANWVYTNMVGQLAAGAVPGDRSGFFFGEFNFDLTNDATIAKLATYH